MLLSLLLSFQLDTLKQQDTINHSITTAYRSDKFSVVQVMPKSFIEKISSNSVADAVKFFSGVQIKDYGGLGGQKTVNVRSLGNQHVGVYVDGVRITNCQNGTVDLGKYSLSSMESIEVCNANKTSSLMSASEFASGSTLYLNTIIPDKTSLSFHSSIGSFNTYKAKAIYSLKSKLLIDTEACYSKGNYPYRIKSYVDGIKVEDTLGVRRNSDIFFNRIDVIYKYFNLKIHGYHYNSVRGLPGGVVRRLSDKYTDVGREWDSNNFLQATYQGDLSKIIYKINAKYTYDYLHYRSDYPENISVHYNNKYTQQDGYLSLVCSYPYKFGNVSISSDLHFSDLTSDVKMFNYVWRLDNKTSVSSSFSLNGWNVFLNGLFTYVKDYTTSSADPLSKITGSAHLSKSFNNFTVRSFYKQIFRAPTLNDLYYTFTGNRRLNPEFVNQFDIGFTYNNLFLQLQIDGYYNLIKDRIICLPLKGTYLYTMLNYGRTQCLGINLLSIINYKNHKLLFSVTYQDDRDRTSKSLDSYNNILPYSPELSFSTVYTFSLKHFDISISHMFVSRRYWTVDNSIESPLPSYNCTDLRIDYHLNHLTLSCSVQDLFDVHYQLINRWPMPGRNILCSLKFEF